MRDDLKQYISTFREMEKNGTLTTSKPLSDYDLAVSYAVNLIGMARGIPCDATVEEIFFVLSLIAPEMVKEHEE